MTKRPDGALFLPFSVEATGGTPLYRQLYEAIRQAILSGHLASGTRLPSSRVLANTLGISRSTVVVAFELLLNEGYVLGQVGKGTWVNSLLRDDLLAAVAPPSPPASSAALLPGRQPSARGAVLNSTSVTAIHAPAEWRAFRPGLPDVDLFPFEVWARLAARRWRQAPRELLGYTDPAGYRPFRAEIAAYLTGVRGIQCEVEQVLIVSGTQQALDLAARVLLDPGDAVWIEDPGYLGARSALQGAGARLIPVRVDGEGLEVVDGIRQDPDARLVYVTPASQFPLGITMSLARRLELLQWATRARAWILEDDYDNEYQYAGRPLSALQRLDPHGRVLYIGTLSKVLFPALRLGYMIVPPDLVEAFTAARAAADRQTPLLEQLVCTDFMTQGHFARHIRATRTTYSERQTMLLESASQYLTGRLSLHPAEGGMHLVGALAAGVDDRLASEEALRFGVIAPPLSAYSLRPPQQSALLLGYTTVGIQEIRAGVRKLATALQHLG